MRFLNSEQVLFIHSRIIDETGGAHGVRDIGLLQSAVARPRATFSASELYTDVFHKAAALAEPLAKNQPFVDGNKRTAIASASVFLGMNGFRLETTQEELVRFAVNLAVGRVTTDEAVAWLRKRCRSRR